MSTLPSVTPENSSLLVREAPRGLQLFPPSEEILCLQRTPPPRVWGAVYTLLLGVLILGVEVRLSTQRFFFFFQYFSQGANESSAIKIKNPSIQLRSLLLLQSKLSGL